MFEVTQLIIYCAYVEMTTRLIFFFEIAWEAFFAVSWPHYYVNFSGWPSAMRKWRILLFMRWVFGTPMTRLSRTLAELAAAVGSMFRW